LSSIQGWRRRRSCNSHWRRHQRRSRRSSSSRHHSRRSSSSRYRTRRSSRRRHACDAAWRSRTDAVITINSFKGSKEICGSKILIVITLRSTIDACTVLVGVNGGEIHRHRVAVAEMPRVRWAKPRWPQRHLKLEGTVRPTRQRPTRHLRRHANKGSRWWEEEAADDVGYV
jgi:hypothetical protein